MPKYKPNPHSFSPKGPHVFSIELMRSLGALIEWRELSDCDLSSRESTARWLDRYSDSSCYRINYILNWLRYMMRDADANVTALRRRQRRALSFDASVNAVYELGRVVLWEQQTGRVWQPKKDLSDR